MASAYKCDRCGILYEDFDRNINSIKDPAKDYAIIIRKMGIYSDRINKTYDLCPKCYKELVKFFYEYKTKEENKE